MDKKTMLVQLVGFSLMAAVVVSPVACTMHRHRLVADAIAGGADPIAAKCAIEEQTDGSPLCLAKALTK